MKWAQIKIELLHPDESFIAEEPPRVVLESSENNSYVIRAAPDPEDTENTPVSSDEVSYQLTLGNYKKYNSIS